MAEYIKMAGLKVLPCTDTLTTAGLYPALLAAKQFNLDLLYGQKISCESCEFLLYPDDKSSFNWLNRFCSEILRKLNEIPGKKLSVEVLEMCLNKINVCGKGRAIFSGNDKNSVITHFIESSWDCFIKFPESKSLRSIEQVEFFSRKYNLKKIFSPELRLTQTSEAKTLQLLRAILGGKLVEEIPPVRYLTPRDLSEPFYSSETCSEAFRSNLEFCHQPTWLPKYGSIKIPMFTEEKKKSFELLKEVSLHGLSNKYPCITDQIRRRFEYELTTIEKLGFTDYFLIVNDITTRAKELGVRVLGRGSAANSLISYALDFTQIDPIKYDLYFERFLNPYRKSPPDIDLDFSWKIRNQIYAYLKTKWGIERVAMISTHITLNSRGAIRETGKAYGVNSDELSYLSSLIGRQSIREFLAAPDKRGRFKVDPIRLHIHKNLLKIASTVEGMPTHFSIHAGGIVIAPDSLYDFTIIQPSSKELPITHIEIKACEYLGLVKLDLLSQRALGVYADIHDHLKTAGKPKIPVEPEIIEADDEVKEKLRTGDTLGVFYIESPGMRGLLAKMKCQSFSELVAASSIIRPGVAESGMMQEYIKRHLGIGKWKPVHPLMAEILKETYGIMVYQEDVMKVANRIAGFSLADADVLRRAMSGKERSLEQMNSAREKFFAGAANKGIPELITREIWRQISSFCGYAFCKAHSASYAVLSMQLLWAKVHYPAMFYASVINNRGGFYGIQAYISAARRSGLRVEPPEINRSNADFSFSENTLLTGLSFIGNISYKTINNIIQERSIRPFSDIKDFLDRVSISDEEWEKLVDSGCFRNFGTQALCRWQRKLLNKSGIFGVSPVKLPEHLAAEESNEILIANELKSLGFAVSGHPINLFKIPGNCIKSNEVANHLNRRIFFAGILIAAKSVTTSRGSKMKFLTLEDEFGLLETVFFPDAWKKNSIALDKACALLVGGIVRSDSGQMVVHGSMLKSLY